MKIHVGVVLWAHVLFPLFFYGINSCISLFFENGPFEIKPAQKYPTLTCCFEGTIQMGYAHLRCLSP